MPPSRDAAAERRRAAAFARIVQWGDPVLRTRALEVDRFDAGLREQAQTMTALMDAAHGAGLAAPQVAIANRLFVYRLELDEPARTLVNPVLVERSDETTSELEGCLSLGQSRVWVRVDRAKSVLVRAQDLSGEDVEFEAEDRHARVIQHELDHLDGVLMLSRTSTEHRRAAMRALREGVGWSPEEPEEGAAGV